MKRGSPLFSKKFLRNAAIVLVIAVVAYVVMYGVKEGFQGTNMDVVVLGTPGSLQSKGVNVTIPAGAKVLETIKYEVWKPAVKGAAQTEEKVFVEVPYGTFGVAASKDAKKLQIGQTQLGLGGILDIGQMKVSATGKPGKLSIPVCRSDNKTKCGGGKQMPYNLEGEKAIQIGNAAFAANTWGNLDNNKVYTEPAKDGKPEQKGNLRITFVFK